MAIQIQGSTIIDDSRNLLTLASLQVKGSSTGYTTITSGNSGATNYTLTIPAVTGNIVTTGDSGSVTNTMLQNNSITINGSSVSLGGSLQIATHNIKRIYRTSNSMLSSSENNSVIEAFQQIGSTVWNQTMDSPENLGSGWSCTYVNTSMLYMSVLPYAGKTINGSTKLDVPPKAKFLLTSDGTSIYAYDITGNTENCTSNYTLVTSNSYAPYDNAVIVPLTDNKFLLVYTASGSYYLQARVVTVNGTNDISLGAVATSTRVVTDGMLHATAINSTTVAVVIKQSIGAFSTISVAGTTATINAASGSLPGISNIVGLEVTAPNELVCVWGTEPIDYLTKLTVSGTTLTASSHIQMTNTYSVPTLFPFRNSATTGYAFYTFDGGHMIIDNTGASPSISMGELTSPGNSVQQFAGVTPNNTVILVGFIESSAQFTIKRYTRSGVVLTGVGYLGNGSIAIPGSYNLGGSMIGDYMYLYYLGNPAGSLYVSRIDTKTGNVKSASYFARRLDGALTKQSARKRIAITSKYIVYVARSIEIDANEVVLGVIAL